MKKDGSLAPLFMIGGTDGSGKGLVVNTLVDLCRRENLNVFDLREYEKRFTLEVDGIICTPSLPSFEKVKKYDIFVAAEPTHSEVGIGVREMLKLDHSAKGIAEGFSFDRYNLDSRLTVPCRKNNIPVIKERGVESSIVYQYEWARYNGKELSLKEITNMAGNTFTFDEYPPSHLIICHCPVDVSIERLKNRDKKDHAKYEEKRDFMENVLQRYLRNDIKTLFEDKGTKVIYLDTDTPSPSETKELVKANVWPLLKEYIK